ncbi:MAG: guanine deaminase [Gammaproteobacteria bacterium]
MLSLRRAERTSSTAGAARVLRGAVLSYRDDPHTVGAANAVRHYRRGALVIGNDGRILWRGHAARLPAAHRPLPCDDYGDALLVAGFIDAHVHFPQHRMLAAPAKDLLDWLARYTFAEEIRYASPDYAKAAAEVFLDHLFAHGTTSALVFSSVHTVAADALFQAAAKRHMALITGKTLMDRNAPENLCDTAQSGVRDSIELIERWHGKQRLRYAITVRFAITSSAAQLRTAGDLLRDHPQCLLQTHLSESVSEIDLVRKLFPRATDYTDVYDHFGLLGTNSVFAHGVHLSEEECARLHETGSTVVHCPTSNTFLGSGLFDLDQLRDPARPVKVGVATDVAGGTSYSMLHTLGEAYKVAALRGQTLTAHDAFHIASRGNAMHLGLDKEIGTLDPGKWADIVVLDPSATPVLRERHALSADLESTLFALMILGDDRAIRATYVAGQQVKGVRPHV